MFPHFTQRARERDETRSPRWWSCAKVQTGSCVADRLTSWWVESISRFHRISGGGEPEALHTAFTPPPCISVTVFGVTSTLGTTARDEQTGKLNMWLYIDLFTDFSPSLFRPLFSVFLNAQYQLPGAAHYNMASHYHSLVAWAWWRPATPLCRLCISGLDRQLLLGSSVWSTSSHKHNPEGFRPGGA